MSEKKTTTQVVPAEILEKIPADNSATDLELKSIYVEVCIKAGHLETFTPGWEVLFFVQAGTFACALNIVMSEGLEPECLDVQSIGNKRGGCFLSAKRLEEDARKKSLGQIMTEWDLPHRVVKTGDQTFFVVMPPTFGGADENQKKH